MKKLIYNAAAISTMAFSYIVYIPFLNNTSNKVAMINFSLAVFLCILIYLFRYKIICMEISYCKMLEYIKNKFKDTQRNSRMPVEQYELMRKNGGYITFEWDIKYDCI